MRSDSRPATGATNIGIAVHGSVSRPDSSGERPCTVWKNCDRKKIDPKTPKNIANDTALVAEKARLRKKRSGSIGSGARRSQSRNAASSATPAVIEPTTIGFVHPSSPARTIPSTSPISPAPASTSPRGSSWASGPWLSFSARCAIGTSASPIGTLTQKIQCHEMPSAIAPPTTGPSATPMPATPDQAPIARPRLPSGSESASKVSVSGVTIAAPRP